MATFLTAQAAVRAALDAHEALQSVEVDGYRPRMRAGVHWGRPRKLGGDYLGVDVNIAARVGDAAKADQVLVSDAALERIAVDGLSVGRRRRLRADGAPRDMHVARVPALRTPRVLGLRLHRSAAVAVEKTHRVPALHFSMQHRSADASSCGSVLP